MIQKLCDAQGTSYTSRVFTMIQDFNSNGEIMQSFHQSKNGNVPLEVFVVNASNWPIKSSPNEWVNLPSDVKRWLEAFDKFYAEKHRDRHLEHVPNFAHAEVRYNITDKRSVNLLLTAHQLAILSLYTRDKTTLSLGEIEKRLSAPTPVVRRQVKPLIINKLLKTSDYSLSSEDVKLSLNPAFTAPEGVTQVSMILDSKDEMRLRQLAASEKSAEASATPSAGEKKEDGAADDKAQAAAEDSKPGDGMMSDSEIAEIVEKERQFILQAATMRIMKKQRKLNVSDLLKRATSELSKSFPVTQPALKTVIASLQQLGFITFDAQSGMVEYVP